MNTVQNIEAIATLIDRWLREEQNGCQFPVDFDLAWKIAGYARKDSAKRYLPKAAQGEFFHVSVEKSRGQGRPKEIIKLSCDGLKHLCLMANTEQGHQVRQYFIEAEKKWRLVQQHAPQFAEEIELLKLQAEITKNQAIAAKAEENRLALCNTFATIHGPELLMGVLGKANQVVHVKESTTEVLNPVTGETQEFLDAKQLKDAVKKRTGQNLKSMKYFVDQVKRKGRDDLIVPVNRTVTSEYITPDGIKEAIDVVYGAADARQMLIGE